MILFLYRFCVVDIVDIVDFVDFVDFLKTSEKELKNIYFSYSKYIILQWWIIAEREREEIIFYEKF